MTHEQPAYPTSSQRRQKRNTLDNRNCKPRAPPQRAHSLPTHFSIGYPASRDGSRLQVRIDDIEDEQPSHINPLDDEQFASGSCSPALSILSPVCTTPVHASPLIGSTHANPYLQRHPPFPPPPPPPPAYIPWRHIPRAPFLRPDAIVHFYKAAATNTHRRRWRTRFLLGHGGLPIDAIPLTYLCRRLTDEAAVQRASAGLKVLERLAPHISRRTFPVNLCEQTAMFGREDVVPVHPRGSPAFDPVLGNIWCDSNGWIVAVTNPEIVFASERVYRELERRFVHCRGQR